MPKVIFLTSLVSEITTSFNRHAPAGFEVTVHPNTLPEAQVVSLVEEADFLILFPSVISDEALKAANTLKLIQLVSAGFDKMNLDLCRELGIPIANNGGANSIDVAEHTIALILAFYRRFLEMDRNVRTDQWRAIDSGMTTYTIHGKTVGIIGMGQIGQKAARLLNAFGAKVLYYDAFPQPETVEKELNVTRSTLEALLEQSDIVTLHVPLNESTSGLIGEEQLSLMQPTALLVNTCRGPVIDETALTRALREGEIAGAALDVLAQEPPDPNNPLLRLENVILSPHTAGVTFDTWSRRGEFVYQNLQRVWDGQPPLAVVGK